MRNKLRSFVSGLTALVLAGCGTETKIENSEPKTEEARITKLSYTPAHTTLNYGLNYQGKMGLKTKRVPDKYSLRLECKAHGEHRIYGKDGLAKKVYNSGFKQDERVLVSYTIPSKVTYKKENGKREEIMSEQLNKVNVIDVFPLPEAEKQK